MRYLALIALLLAGCAVETGGYRFDEYGPSKLEEKQAEPKPKEENKPKPTPARRRYDPHRRFN